MENKQNDNKNESKTQRNIVINFFSSIKLTIFVLLVLVLSSILGTLTPILPGALTNYPVYSSWWFILFLFLLLTNIIVCSLSKYPVIRESSRLSSKSFDRSFVDRLENSVHLKSSLSPQELKPILKVAFKRHKIPIAKVPKTVHSEDSYSYRADKGRLSRYSFYITHLSLLIIGIGAILGSLFGFKAIMHLSIGEQSNICYSQNNYSAMQLPFYVRCNDFRLTYYPETDKIKDYLSDLSVLINDEIVKRQTIEVNHPLFFNGIKLYQHTYGQEVFNPEKDALVIEILNRDSKEIIGQISLRQGEKQSFDPSSPALMLEITDFQPDFVIDKEGKFGSRSRSMNNPAVRLRISDKEKELDHLWVFAKFPELAMGERKTSFLFHVSFPQSGYYTGLQVVKDPGVPFIWIGGILLSVGMFSVFFLSHRKFYILVSPGKKTGSTILFGAKTNKNRMALRQQFSSIIKELETRGVTHVK